MNYFDGIGAVDTTTRYIGYDFNKIGRIELIDVCILIDFNKIMTELFCSCVEGPNAIDVIYNGMQRMKIRVYLFGHCSRWQHL
jgi:hypothetical protein